MAQNDQSIDMVPRLGDFAEWIEYKMPEIDFVTVDSAQGAKNEGCPGTPGPNSRRKTFDLHLFPSYCGWSQSYATLVAGISSELKDVCWVAFNNSYESDRSKVADKVSAYGEGWELLGHVAKPENFGIWDDVSNLIINRNTGVCLLTFEGSDSINDWANNANLFKTTWCELPQKVHTGISKELMTLVSDRKWQTEIRANLNQCGEVQVMGHSLGGGMATLFSACANNPNSGSDYGNIGWGPNMAPSPVTRRRRRNLR